MFNLPRNHSLAFRAGPNTVTFAEFHARVSAWEKVVVETRADALAIRMANRIEDVALVVACLNQNRPLAILDQGYSYSDLEKRLKLLPSGFDFTSQTQFVGGVANLHPQASLILFTSGSSGEPKAVQLSRENILSNTNAVLRSIHFSEIEKQSLFLPLSYSFGLLGQVLPALQVGKSTELYTDLMEFFRTTARSSPSGMLSGVPTHWEALLRMWNQPCPDVTHLVSAGARLNAKLRARLKERFPRATIYNNYGQTEASPRILSLTSKDKDFFSDFTGYAVGDFKIKLSTSGELLASGPQVMLGYTTVGDSPVQEGWLNTGDLAEITASGLVKILGRKDDLIKVGGTRLSLGELEGIYKTALETESLAVLSAEHELRGQIITLYLAASGFSTEQARGILAEKCDRHRLPHEILLMPEIPKLSNGKVDRVKLRKIAKPS